MLTQRLVWGGGVVVTGIGTFLSFAQVQDQFARWSSGLIFGLLLIASMVVFPWGQNEDGTSRRLLNVLVRGRGNASFASGDNSPNTGNIVNTGKGTQRIRVVGAQWTFAEVRQISLDASRAEVLPAARTVASEAARLEIDRRSDMLTDKVLARINETNPDLFRRWDDPRFLAALTSAQRSVAETGDENLADLQANLLAALASQTARTRREIILRQAIDIAPRLTTEHVNALAVSLFLSNFRLSEPYSTEQTIRAFATLLQPYYGRLPSSEIDYLYMSSTGVCYRSELGAFANTPYQTLRDHYPNAMYPAFTLDDLRDNLLRADNPDSDEVKRLLAGFVHDPDDVIQHPDGATLMNPETARFRVSPPEVPRVLARQRDLAGKHLTPVEQELREMVLKRSLNEAQLKDTIQSIEPDLAQFLDYVHRTGALNHPLNPVGFLLAQNEIGSRAPQLVAVIDAAFDDA